MVKTNEILADLYDLMATFRYEMVTMLSGKRQKKPTPYKRPRKDDKKKVGKGAMLKEDLKNWIKSKLEGSESRGK